MNLGNNILSNACTPERKFIDVEEPRQYSQKKGKKDLKCDTKIKKKLTPEQKLEASRERGRLKYHRRKIREELKQKDKLGQEDLKIDEQTIRYNMQILKNRTSEELKALRQSQKRQRVAAIKEEKREKKRKREAEESMKRELKKRCVQERSAEEKKAYRLKCQEIQRKSRRKKREKQNEILRKANELLAISQHREMSSDEKELLKLAEEIKANKLKRKRVVTPEQKIAAKLKRQEKQKRIRAAKNGNHAVDDHTLNYYRDIRLKRAETDKRSRDKRLDKENTTLRKANELLEISKNQEISQDDKEVIRLAEQIRAKRLRTREMKRIYRIIREAEETPEEKEARRLKKLEETRRYRQKQKATATPEEIEAKRLIIEKDAQLRKEKREKEDLILKTALELLCQKQEISSEGKEILRLADEIKADRLIQSERRRQYHLRRNKDLTPKEREKQKVGQRRWIQKKREQIKAFKQEEFSMKNATGWLQKDQVFDEIKIEKEILQESTIKAIPVQYANSNLDLQQESFNDSSHMQQEGFNDSSCSWIQLSEKSFMTEGTSKSHVYFQSFRGGSSSIQKSLAKRNGHSTKLDWRKPGLEKFFRCMRILIDSTAKRDTHAVFGKEIAQKLRTSKKDEAEVNVAKLLIDNILQNLIIGVYNSEKMIA